MVRTAAAASLALAVLASPIGLPARQLPARLSDAAFWELSTRASETGGTFPSDNFVSNEAAFQTVVPRLRARAAAGGAYVGVGPEQNFTYVVAVEPAIAFIVDLRRQNLLHHLLYKAVIELSPSRVEFLSRLFSRPRPLRSFPRESASAILAASAREIPEEQLFKANLAAVIERLTRRHRFPLTAEDRASIEAIYRAFFRHGPQISYAPVSPTLSAPPTLGSSVFPTFAELMAGTDAAGTAQSYLASDENYAVLRQMQNRNLIVPVVGDFSGPVALRTLGRYLRERGVPVTTFYTSNVEQYLFQGSEWRRFYDNVGSMPIDPSAMFIRAYFPRTGSRRLAGGNEPLHDLPLHVTASLLAMRVPSVTMSSSIRETLAAVAGDKVQSYADIVALSE